MRRFFIVLGVLLFLLNITKAQECPLRVRFNVTPATCYNNGKVAYALTDASGNILTTAVGTGLSEVRIYYKANETDSAHYSGSYLVGQRGITPDGQMLSTSGWDTLTIDYGTYIIGVEALCWDGHGYTRIDTQSVLNIGTTYKKPSISTFYDIAKTLNGFGSRPSLDCENTGRVQLKIENGTHPYSIAVVDHDTGDTLRTLVFETAMYSGTDPSRYDYKNYYSVDSLPPGNWDFYLVDGCGYNLPRAGQIVDVIDFPKLDYVEVFASSGNKEDSNVVKINAVLDKPYEYYAAMMPQFAQYRFIYNGEPSSDWKPFPAILSGYRATLYDTITSADKYCDIWNNDITLEFNRTQCGDFITSRTFQYKMPDTNRYYKTYSDIRDSDYVTNNLCGDRWYWHRNRHVIGYSPGERINNYNKNNDHADYRYHITYPLTWIYRDTERDAIIKKDTVNHLSESRLYDHEVEAIYGSFRDYTLSNPLRIPVERQLVDAHGCVLYTRFDSLDWCYDIGGQISSWTIREYKGNSCCTQPSRIVLSEYYHSQMDPDGTTIRLVRSPYNDMYNFQAVYSSATRSWTVTRSNLENTANISGRNDGLNLTFSDFCLPSGPYHFVVETPCDTFDFNNNYRFPDAITTEMVEEPVFSAYQECTDRYITYTQGRFAKVSRNTSVTTGLPLEPDTTNLQTYFQIIEGPMGGYDATQHGVNYPFRVTMPGDYVVRIKPSTSGITCGLPVYYDTIHYDGATVDFSYAYAYLCDSNCVEGTAYVKGFDGTPPYTYTLYDQPEKQGNIVEVITISDTAQPAIFLDKQMNISGTMSCKIEDACGASFHVNIRPLSLKDVNKAWFDNGMTVVEACEGATVSVYALDIASLLEYEWYNPAGELIDSANTTSLFIPRGADDGWYKVVIRNTSCADSIVDSVHVTVRESPIITLNQNAEVCPGEEVALEFTPVSPTGDNITFAIAFENGIGVMTRTYSTTSATTVSDFYTTYSNAKIYPLSVDDGNCEYTIADANDTIYVQTKSNIANACTMIGSVDTVCYGSDALFAARSTLEKPYIIRWYSDFEMTHLLKEEEMTVTGPDTSFYDTLALTQHAEVFISIEKDGWCPTVYGIPTQSVNITSGETILECGQVLQVYDNGGPTGDYQTGESLLHSFSTADGKPVTLHFDELDLSNTAHLFIFSGTEFVEDSVLCELSRGSSNPGLLTSYGNTISLYFLPGLMPASGWSAIVEHSPGMSVADVKDKVEVIIQDEVCQSQVNTYDDPYHVVPDVVSSIDILNANIREAGTYTYIDTLTAVNGCDSVVTFILKVSLKNIVAYQDEVCQSQTKIYDDPYHVVPSIVSYLDTLTNNIRTAGTYIYTNTFSDMENCDSIVSFILKVNPPQYHDTTVVTTNLHGGQVVWHDDTYEETGRYEYLTADANECDMIDILNFILLQVDTSDNDICYGDSTTLSVMVTTPDLSVFGSGEQSQNVLSIGDVVCSDGSILSAESVEESGKTPIGVVFYVDKTGHGLMVSLNELYNPASDSYNNYCYSFIEDDLEDYVRSIRKYSAKDCILDMNGRGNTLMLKQTAEAAPGHDFATNAPAAYQAYYYDPISQKAGPTHQGWYLPAAGEANLLYANRIEVNKTLELLKSYGLTVNTFFEEARDYITSTQCYDCRNYDAINMEDDGMFWVGEYYTDSCFGVRPIKSF